MRRGRGQLWQGLAYARTVPEILAPVAMMALIGTLTYEYEHACLLGGDRGAAGGEELLDLLLGLHDDEPRPARRWLGDPAGIPLNRDSHVDRMRALLNAMSSALATSTAKD